MTTNLIIDVESFKRNSFKNRRMSLNVTNTRYSLVKGERIIAMCFSHDSMKSTTYSMILYYDHTFIHTISYSMWTLVKNVNLIIL